MKQETLEEAALNFSKQFLNNGENSEYEAQAALIGVKFGAKWQAKKMYSVEEVLEHLNHLIMMKSSELDKFTDDQEMVTMKWFEKFKKKA
jgi:hypothetical protein